MAVDPQRPLVLFTAFEPSGDDLAGAVALELRRREPSIRLAAWGGPKLRAAGAEIVEDTGGEAVMGIPGPGVVVEHLRQIKRIERWMAEHRPSLHVPVDSPAANFPVCQVSRKLGAPVCHLAAPQLWAWAPWRIGKLRRLTDRLLCLLPFEEAWFGSRGVPTTFIGHPVFDQPFDAERVRRRAASFRDASPRVALLPGSRPKELASNFPVMLGAYRELRRRHPGLGGMVAAVSDDAERRLRSIAEQEGGWPEGLDLAVGDIESVIAWADLCLAVSGTVTLHITRQAKPMVVMFKARRLLYHLFARWLIYADHLAMPNLLAGAPIVPELMPYFGGPSRLVEAAEELLRSPQRAEAQRDALRRVRASFEGVEAAGGAAEAILALLSERGSLPQREAESACQEMDPEGVEPSRPLRGSGF